MADGTQQGCSCATGVLLIAMVGLGALGYKVGLGYGIEWAIAGAAIGGVIAAPIVGTIRGLIVLAAGSHRENKDDSEDGAAGRI